MPLSTAGCGLPRTDGRGKVQHEVQCCSSHRACLAACLPDSISVAAQAVRTIVARDGIRRGMFAGYGAFLLRDLPFDAIEFWAFDTLNMRLKEVVKRELNPVEHAVCGAIAGAITGARTPGTPSPPRSDASCCARSIAKSHCRRLHLHPNETVSGPWFV